MSFSLKKIILSFSFLSGVLLIAYLYFVNASVIKLVERKNEENVIKSMGGELTKLESEYMRLTAGLNMELAKKLGFESVTKMEFARATKANKGLSLRGHAEI